MDKELEKIKYAKFIGFCKNGDKTIEEIRDKFSLNKSQVLYRLNKFNLGFIKSKRGKVIRNEKILKLVKEDELTYREIGEIFGISRQCVHGIINSSGYSRWSDRKKKYRTIANNVKRDIKLGVSYIEIREKYTYSVLTNLYSRGLLPPLYTKILIDRNELITHRYKRERAIDIVKSDDIGVNNPNGVETQRSVYTIASNNGFKKFPKIGRRCDGGTFEDKKILRYIEKKRDKDGWSFKDIADKLTHLGYKTLTGKYFDMANVYYKYNAYKKNKYKILKH
jgi:predicted DNA-binding protein YlxM (UPF0122 family)